MAVEITLEGEIGWELGVWEVKRALAEAKGKDIIVNFSSPGGSVFTGITIFNLFKNYSGNVEFHIIGYAASMGSYIPLSGSKITAEANAVFMIHNARSGIFGDHNAMIKRAQLLEGLSGLMANAYIQKTGKSEADVRAMMDNETFLFGEEIKTAGFVDEIKGKEDSDPNAKSTFVAVAKETFEACMAKVGSEKPDDYEQAAALLTDLTAVNCPTIDNNKEKGNSVGKQKNVSEATSTPATADNEKTEDSIMNLEEFRAQGYAENAELNTLLAAEKEAGRAEGKTSMEAIIKKACVALDSEKSYPEAVRAFALKALSGEEDVVALTGFILAYDVQQEEKKSEAAKAESEGLKDTPGGDHDIKKDGLAKTPEDIAAMSKLDRGVA